MKESPLLFNAPMVRAILEGRKSQTRRLVKPQPPCGCEYGINGAGTHAICFKAENPAVWVPPTAKSKDHRLPSPYGGPGDRIWCKETFALAHKTLTEPEVIYRADDPEVWGSPWTPSIFMPRKASRITLEITGIRVERLNEISEEDAVAEGVIPKPDAHIASKIGYGDFKTAPYRLEYYALWESINGKKAPWSQNCWVWVIEFKKL